MVYIAFDPNDGFWKKTASSFFMRHNYLTNKVSTVINRKVVIYETSITDNQNRNILYYIGHGRSSGTPISFGNDINSLVNFVLSLNDVGIQMDCITFFSCYAYDWIVANYRRFSRMLTSLRTIRLEGSKGEISMCHIIPTIKPKGTNRFSTIAPLEHIQLSIIEDEMVVQRTQQRRNLATIAENTILRTRNVGLSTRVTAQAVSQSPNTLYKCTYVENIALGFESDNYIRVRAQYREFFHNRILTLSR